MKRNAYQKAYTYWKQGQLEKSRKLLLKIFNRNCKI